MTAAEVLKYLQQEIHTTVAATTDKDGLPVTGQDDKDFHGFGMKSMRMVVEQYGGELIVSFADNIFKVQIVLPHD